MCSATRSLATAPSKIRISFPFDDVKKGKAGPALSNYNLVLIQRTKRRRGGPTRKNSRESLSPKGVWSISLSTMAPTQFLGLRKDDVTSDQWTDRFPCIEHRVERILGWRLLDELPAGTSITWSTSRTSRIEFLPRLEQSSILATSDWRLWLNEKGLLKSRYDHCFYATMTLGDKENVTSQLVKTFTVQIIHSSCN